MGGILTANFVNISKSNRLIDLTNKNYYTFGKHFFNYLRFNN
jgi:hypothetical protein